MNISQNQYCCCLVAKSCSTLCNPMEYSKSGSSVHYLPEFAQTHVYWVYDAIQPSHPLSSPSPAFNRSQHQGLFQWVGSLYQVAKYWNHYTPQFLNDKIKLTHIFQKKYAIFQSTYSCNSEMKVLFVFDSLQSHGSHVHGILQKGILEWVAFPFSRGSSQPRD